MSCARTWRVSLNSIDQRRGSRLPSRAVVAWILAVVLNAAGFAGGSVLIPLGPFAAGACCGFLSEGKKRFLAPAIISSGAAYLLAPVFGAFEFHGDNWLLAMGIFLLLVAAGFALGLAIRHAAMRPSSVPADRRSATSP